MMTIGNWVSVFLLNSNFCRIISLSSNLFVLTVFLSFNKILSALKIRRFFNVC